MLLPPRVVVLLGLLAVLPSASAFFSSFTTASSHRAPLNQVLSPIRRSSAAAASGETHQASELVGKERLKRFLEDASFLGPVRFVTMNDGGILEAVGSFEGVRYKELPKGEYATFASDDKTFECHINLDAVASVVMVQSKAKHGDYDNYITRFLDKDGKVLVSSMLHKPVGEDQYEEDAVAWWEKLRAIFGEKQQISSNNSN